MVNNMTSVSKSINRIMIAGTSSGCGKTTVTCAILKALSGRGLKLASFKCGPDYIDPMFHSEILKTKSSNIDFFLTGEKEASYLFAKNSSEAELSVVEGVMGFYDGMGGNSITGSSFEISEKLGIPAVLVVDCRGASYSVAAMIKGFLELYRNSIRAVILNRVSEAMFPVYKEFLERELPVKVLGFMPKEPAAALESRHLGLITAKELEDLEEKMALLAQSALAHIDLEALLALAGSAEPLCYEEPEVSKIAGIRLGVAKDKAFCFYYEDSLKLLAELGAELRFFSPLTDKALPAEIDGLLFGGGYPELYPETLSNNIPMLDSIRSACKDGMPVYAECGGYMYLGREISGYPMAGIIDMSSRMTERLQNFGYVTLTADKDTLLLQEKEQVRAHEFHYSVSDSREHVLTARKASGRSWEAGYCRGPVFALYPHIHMWGNRKMAERLIKACEAYQNGRLSARMQ